MSAAFLRVLSVLLLLSTACVNIERSYPDKRYFVLELDRARKENPSGTPGNGILEIADVRISPRYTEKNFVYRTSETRYESDFYNQFLVAPSALMAEEIRKALAGSHAFEHVVGPASYLAPTHVLEASVNALYGDFRNLNLPKAVLEIEVFLSKADNRSQIVLNKRYARSVDIDRRSPEALVEGWNRALEEIIAALVKDLGAVT